MAGSKEVQKKIADPQQRGSAMKDYEFAKRLGPSKFKRV
jgi:hypothetical protein